jgi:hypothetical protein
MPSDPDALPRLPIDRGVGTGLIDNSSNFVTWDAWKLNSGPDVFPHNHIAVADATGQNFNSYLSGTGLRHFAFHQFERGTWLCDLGGQHLFHAESPRG